VQPCIRPLIAAALAAGPDIIRGLGPNQKHALLPRMALVAGLPNRRFRPFRINVVITPAVPQRTNATSYCHRQAPSHAAANQADRQVLSLINSAQAIRAILLASATATTLKGRRARSRVTQGVSLWIELCPTQGSATTNVNRWERPIPAAHARDRGGFQSRQQSPALIERSWDRHRGSNRRGVSPGCRKHCAATAEAGKWVMLSHQSARDSHGRFQKGNIGGPGRPKGSRKHHHGPKPLTCRTLFAIKQPSVARRAIQHWIGRSRRRLSATGIASHFALPSSLSNSRNCLAFCNCRSEANIFFHPAF
jgi:hypothetical protein